MSIWPIDDLEECGEPLDPHRVLVRVPDLDTGASTPYDVDRDEGGEES